MNFGYGTFGLLDLVLAFYCAYLIVNSRLDPGMKLVWIIVVFALPLLGAILYLLFGRTDLKT